MKTKKLFSAVALACAVAGLATVGCANNSSTRKAKSAGETVLNLYDTSGGVVWTDTVASNPAGCGTGGYWDSTYTTHRLAFGEFVFDHDGGVWPGSTIKYWGGFTFGTNGDTYCYSDTSYCKCCRPPVWCDSTGSAGWINNQWGVIAGAGLDTLNFEPQKGAPYLIAFGSGIDVWLKDSVPFKPLGVYICNHPWPYYGNIYGDGFARPLDNVGDYFVLIIEGLDEDGDVIGTVTDTLAKYNPKNPAAPIQPKTWHQVVLDEEIARPVQNLRFSLETTDTGPYGPNTAFYFCMDKLKVDVDTKGVAGSVTEKTAVKKTAIQKPKKKDVEEFVDHLTVGSHVAGEAVLYNAQGQVALKTVLKAGSNKLDTKKLPAGKYTMVHHHRVKHFVKK
ncbi:MAG: DUF4465 domain-containing protein [Prevotellaceae bacterium]|jgi:hypothetical protein|nr:DUF4465 domain-containing protein [Prevotellaceae bacterium]